MTKLKVGFDFDGVILDNPVRCFRPIARSLKFIKPTLFHQKKDPFYYPNTSLEKTLWRLLHKTSFRVAPGIINIKRLIKDNRIEAYIVSGRYQCLQKDFKSWLKKIGAEPFFKQCMLNKDNLQPNDFKEKMINKLRLDIYVEDNWDIIERLNHHTKAKIFWVSNILDSRIPYQYKFFSLKEVAQYLMR